MVANNGHAHAHGHRDARIRPERVILARDDHIPVEDVLCAIRQRLRLGDKTLRAAAPSGQCSRWYYRTSLLFMGLRGRWTSERTWG